MNKLILLVGSISLSSVILTSGGQKKTNPVIAATSEAGSLSLVANGEDFVRQGFTSKDGWQISFERVYVNIANASAYSTPDGFEPQKGDTKSAIEYQEKVDFLNKAQIFDLAEGEADAPPIVVGQSNVPAGFYNALSFQLTTAEPNSAIAGHTIVLIGKASKDQKTISFNLGFNQPAEYLCGEFIGDERQGIVTADNSGTVEATFHFDHIFGDADTPAGDALNQDALGFQPLAALAKNGTIKLLAAELASSLTESDYQKLTTAVEGLGHVGEGHCEIIQQ